MKRTALFVVTLFSVLGARAADVATTLHFTPDLAREANPLVSELGLGWTGLLVSNAAAVALFLLVPLWLYWRGPAPRLEPPAASAWDFTARCLYRRSLSRGRLLAALCTGWPLPRDRMQAVRWLGFSLSWAVVAGSALAVLSWWAQHAWHWAPFSAFRSATAVGGHPTLELAGAMLAGALATLAYFRMEFRAARAG